MNPNADETSATAKELLSSQATEESSPVAKRRKVESSARQEEYTEESLSCTAKAGPKIAIIVPFRDLHVEQKRSEHLRKFIPEMSRYDI